MDNIDTGTRETLDMHSGRLSAKHRASEFVHKHDKVHKALLIKDKCAISNGAFYELSVVSDLPSSNQVKRLACKFNKTFLIHPSPHGIVGVQQSLRERIGELVDSLCRNETDAPMV